MGAEVGRAIGVKAVALAISSLALAAISQTAASAPLPRALAKQCKAELRQFGRIAKQAWRSAASAIGRHEKLRGRVGALMPVAPTRILLYADAGHHTAVALSYVATQNAKGEWQVDLSGETGPGLLDTPTEPIPPRSWRLLAVHAARLRELLANPCVHAEPPSFYRASKANPRTVHYVLDIVTPDRARTQWGLGAMEGLNGEILALVTYEPRLPSGLPLRTDLLDYSIPR